MILALATGAWIPNPSAAEVPHPGSPVCVLTIHEDITHNTLFLVRRGIREAETSNARALIAHLDTNGGRVDVTEEIMQALQQVSMPTLAFVDHKAYSAGAFIAAATEKIYMAPGSVIGAATPILIAPGGGGGVQELPASYEEKITSAMRALIRTTAQENGHNPSVFEAMVDADQEVKIGEEIICAKGKLLTLTNEEAARSYGDPPQALLSAGTLDSLTVLLREEAMEDAPLVRIEPFGFEVVARWITTLSPILITIGVLAIYVEMNSPGIGVPAGVAVAVFAIYFTGYFIAGLAGWEETALFAIGMALLIVEIFILPGFGVAGIAGTIAIMISLVWAMTPMLPADGPSFPGWQNLRLPLIKLGIGLGGAMLGGILLGRYLPHSWLFRKLTLSTSTSAAEGYVSSSNEARDLVGASGVAATVLRPSGQGRFGDRLVDVVTSGDMIAQDTPIEVVAVNGSRVEVRRKA